MKRYILTGTPGSGKTSILHALQSDHYEVIEEAATDIISSQQALGIKEPWEEFKFIDDIVLLQKERQIHPSSANIQFYDRSSLCSYALCLYLEFEPSRILKEEIERLNKDNIFQRKVFFIENLGFCEKTHARTISFEDAIIFEKIHEKVYADFGYELIKIKKDTIINRKNEIIKYVFSDV